jgi:PmbA protein
MEKLLGTAKKASDKAEVYSISYTDKSVSFEDAKLHDIESKFQSGVSLRMIKNGKVGFAYTRNLIDRDELVKNAAESLKGAVEANYDLPATKKLPKLDIFDPSVEKVSGTDMVKECARICEVLKAKTDAEISVGGSAFVEDIRILNTEGTDISDKSTLFVLYASTIYPGTGSGIARVFLSKKSGKMPESILKELIQMYKLSSSVVEPKGGKMKVMFMPNSMYTLQWRISSGASAKSIYEKISPIADKLGKEIFDKKITIYDDPLNDKYPGARAFDDEGVACKPLTIVENGVLKSFYYDLDYAKKLNAASTGHGHRTGQWGGDSVTLKPTPSLVHTSIKPGKKSFSELVKSIDRGIILEGVLGAHSGNIPNGDYSVGVSPALYVEKGEVLGRVKDAMVAGNVYETLKHVVDVGDTLYPSFSGWMPAVIFDDVSVMTKK